MSTRKIKDAKDLSTGELIYFKGHAQATFMSDGRTVEEVVSSTDTSGKNEVEYISDLVVTIGEMRPNVVYWIDGADDVMIDSFKAPVSGVETYDVFTAVMILGSMPSASVSLTLPDNVTWANGEIPTIEVNNYELSISRISDGYGYINYFAVLTPFKSV